MFWIFRCTKSDTESQLSYLVVLCMGLFLCVSSLVASLAMKKLSSKTIMSMKLSCYHVRLLLNVIILSWIGVWILTSVATCISLNFSTEFIPIAMGFIVTVSACASASIMMAVAVNSYTTSYRGMATSFIFMFGRVGGFSGSNTIGLLLANHCSTIFYLNAAILIGKFCDGFFCALKFY